MAVESQLSELLSIWEVRRDQGHPASPDELCAGCPELLEELKRRVRALESLNAILDVLRNGEASVSTPPSDPASCGPGTPPDRVAGAGWTVAGYEVLGVLGHGGMGVVYKARQVALNRLVALKMILAGAHAGPTRLARFRLEAETAARLQHPNIVQIYEVGEHDGQPFLALELVDGGSLARKLAGTPLPPSQAGRLVETLARAMHAAHQCGIVHRDLKPANILLARSDRPEAIRLGSSPEEAGPYEPKITDFGLAKRLDEAVARTQSGAILGTASYMAPEQATGNTKEIGPAADVYALGGILYEALTGRPPFLGTTLLETLEQVRSQEPVPPSSLQPKVPRDLETITLKCLAKEPARRYCTAGELAADLNRYLAGKPIQARPVGAWERAVKWARRRPAVAALMGVSVAAVVALLVTGLVYNARLQVLLGELAARQADLERANAAVEREQQAAHDTNRQAQARLERVNRADGLRHLDRDDLRGALTLFAEAIRSDPDDPERQEQNRIRFLTTLRRFPRLVQTFDHQDQVSYAEFSPDGRYLVTAGDDRVARLWDTATGRALGPPLPHTAVSGSGTWPAASP
jgi:outer membrane murein-binding lipoprotein Lpp